jgi:hypothetical protein
MNGVETFGLGTRQVTHLHGTDSEFRILDTLYDPAGVTRSHGVGLDDGKCPFHK